MCVLVFVFVCVEGVMVASFSLLRCFRGQPIHADFIQEQLANVRVAAKLNPVASSKEVVGFVHELVRGCCFFDNGVIIFDMSCLLTLLCLLASIRWNSLSLLHFDVL